MNFPSKDYVNWHKDATLQLTSQNVPTCKEIGQITIVFFAADKRKTDLTNKAESIMDLLTDNGIIEDDNWFVVPAIVLNFAGVEKNNPRAEIEIS